MTADDRALRHHSRETLAAAMYEVAAGRTPRAASGAGGSGAAVRLYRLLTPEAGPRRATRLGIAAGSLATMLLPLLIACGPALG
ncbi:hypothetical protein [Streptomyces sp. SS8]